MFNRRTISIFTALIVLALVSVACKVSLPGGLSNAESIATYTAATVNALTGSSTPESHALPTLAPDAGESTAVPVVAPLSIAFVGPDRNAYYWNETLVGTTQLTSSGDVTSAYVSPDGSLVAITRTTDEISYTLEVINHDGSGLRTLLAPAGFAAMPRPAESLSSIPGQVSWIPNRHTIAMSTRITFEGPGSSTGNSLYFINAEDGSMTAPITLSDVWYYRYTFSPDGARIAISIPEGIEMYNPDGSKLDKKVLAYEFVNTASEYAWVASPVWSADSTTLVAAVPPKEPFTDPVADSTVWRVAADGLSGELTMSRQMMYFPGGFASISPNLTKILYLTRFGAPEANLRSINISNIDGSGEIVYASGNIHQPPVWSKDSSKFYYYDQDLGAFIGQEGATPQSLPDFNSANTVQWIDGNRFVGAVGPAGGWKLLLGTLGSPTGVIYSTPISSGSLNFTLNR